MIGIIGAMEVEVERLREQMEDPVKETVSGMEFVRGKLRGQNVVLAKSGIGKVFAAICAQTMAIRYGVTTLVNSGVAGTMTPELHIGDVAISTACVQHDMDTSALGDPVGLISGINIVELPCDASLADGLEAAAKKAGVNCRRGLIASGDQFVAGERRNAILERFSPVAVEMESGAIAQVAYVNGCRFVALRVISDEADGSAQIDYPTFVKKAAATSSGLVLDWLASL